MKKTTSLNLSKRVAQYGALSLAIAGVADANGQIIYTDAGNIGGVGATIHIDMNNNGDYEFFIRQKANYLSIAALQSGSTSANPYPGSILGYDGNFGYPFALGSGYVISDGNATWMPEDANFKVMNFENNCGVTSYYSNWCNVQDRFLGLRFKIGIETHYGWARLDVEGNTNSGFGFILKDYAYNATPGACITAGNIVAVDTDNDGWPDVCDICAGSDDNVDTDGDGIPDGCDPLSIDDSVFSKIKIVALNKSIALFNLPPTTNYKLYSLTGQSVLNGDITNSTHTIEANTLATGIYILKLQDANTKAVLTKKIVL